MFPKIDSAPSLPKANKNPNELLKYAVLNNLYKITKGTPHAFLPHNSLAAMLFNAGSREMQEYLSVIKEYYEDYFQIDPADSKRLKKRLDLDSIIEDFPEWIDKTIDNKERTYESIQSGSLRALQDELKAAYRDKIKNTYKVKTANLLPEVADGYLYELTLELESDDYIKVYEGIKITWILDDIEFDVTSLTFDSLTSTLAIKTENIIAAKGKAKSSKIRIDGVWLIKQLSDRINELEAPADSPLNDIINLEIDTISPQSKKREIHYGSLDESQRASLTHALNYSVTLLWGPPGTGKSFALGHLLQNLLDRNERTLVCCTANVAVDAVTHATINAIESKSRYYFDFHPGSVLRAGYTRDIALLGRNYLFPDSPEINLLRNQITSLYEKMKEESSHQKIQTLAEIVTLKEKLSFHIKQRFEDARIIFATASLVHVDATMQDLDFDNIVIDEGSMMSVPHFLPIAIKANKRIIIAGDFRQLGPVALSTTRNAREWLHKDLFEFSGLDYKHGTYNSPYLCQLVNQRRFHTAICSIINKILYNNKLLTVNQDAHTLLWNEFPEAGKSYAFINLPETKGYKCELTAKGSRKNSYSAEFIFRNLIIPIGAHPLLHKIKTIGIISPYRAQIGLHTSLINGAPLHQSYKEKIKLGTIHAFQGSEADLIILDLVESSHESLGKLYHFEEGTRLINVAVSRPRSKLIVVGNISNMFSMKGHLKLSIEANKILSNIQLSPATGNFNFNIAKQPIQQ